MNEIKVIGIDMAKSVFQVCVCMSDRNIASSRKVSRAKLLDTIRPSRVDDWNGGLRYFQLLEAYFSVNRLSGPTDTHATRKSINTSPEK